MRGRLIYRALKRILLPSLSSPIFFCDVILADILTSFAKVLGDLWVSACQIWFGGITHGRVSQSGWSRWVTLGMVWYVLLDHHIIYLIRRSASADEQPPLRSPIPTMYFRIPPINLHLPSTSLQFPKILLRLPRNPPLRPSETSVLGPSSRKRNLSPRTA